MSLVLVSYAEKKIRFSPESGFALFGKGFHSCDGIGLTLALALGVCRKDHERFFSQD